MTALQELARSFNQQLRDPSSQGQITIDEAVVGTAGLDALIARSLGLAAGELKVRVPGGSVPDPGAGPLEFSGSSTLLGLTGQSVALTFMLDGGEIVLDMTIVPAGTWKFATCFADLRGSSFEALTHPGDQSAPWVRLVFASFYEREVPGAPNPTAVTGLNFSANILVEGLFDVLLGLLAPSRTGTQQDTPPVAPLTGVIELVKLTLPNGESMLGTSTRLQASLMPADQPSNGITIGPVQISELYVAIENRYAPVDAEETTGVPAVGAGGEDVIDLTTVTQTTTVCFGGTTSVFERAPVTMEVDLTNPSSASSLMALRFWAMTPNTNIVELSDLIGLLGASGWQGAVPSEFSGATWLSFGLSGASVVFLLGPGHALTVVELAAEMCLREAWTLYTTESGTSFTLQPLQMGFRILTPGSGQTIAGSVDATLTIATDPRPLAFEAGVTFDAQGVWTVRGAYLGDVSLSLDELNGQLFPDSGLPNPQDRFFTGVSFCRPGFAIAFDPSRRELAGLWLETGLDARLDLFGAKIFELYGGELVVTYMPVSGASGQLTGTVFIVEIGFTMIAKVEAKGLEFEGRQLIATPIELMRLAGQLLPGSLAPPGGATLAVSGLALTVDTVTSTYSGSGRIDMQWPLTIGNGASKLVTNVTASISSRPASRTIEPVPGAEVAAELWRAIVRHRQAAHGPQPELLYAAAMGVVDAPPDTPLTGIELVGAGRTYEVALSGSLELTDHFAITLGFKYTPAKTTITGGWEQSESQHFDWEEVASALGISSSGLALPQSAPEFPLAKLSLLLELAGQTKIFQLTGETTARDAGYFLARSAPQSGGGSWGFAVGVMLPAAGWAITSIPELASVLEGFGFQRAAVLIFELHGPEFHGELAVPLGRSGDREGLQLLRGLRARGKHKRGHGVRARKTRADEPATGGGRGLRGRPARRFRSILQGAAERRTRHRPVRDPAP